MFLQLTNGRIIGEGQPTYVIAEIGSNHNGSIEKAKELILLAKAAGADAAKFQSFQVEKLINQRQYVNEKWVPHPAWDVLKKLSLPKEWHGELADFAREHQIDFLSTPFNDEAIEILAGLKVPALKIASGDLTNKHLLETAAKTHLPIILSTGAAKIGEVERAMGWLTEAGAKQIALLHCTSLYPTPFSEVNLMAIKTLQRAFRKAVGFSDHSLGTAASIGAVALGAVIIEKHFTDSRQQEGPDHPHSLNPQEFSQMVTQIRHLESALGDGIKSPSLTEKEERIMARRGIYAAKEISKGTKIAFDLLKIVRPAYSGGISAAEIDCVIGKTTKEKISAGELLSWNHLT